MKLPSTKVMVLNGALLLVVAASGITVLRSLLVHDDAPVCTERYLTGAQFGIERDGQPLSIEEFQARTAGTDWGLLEAARVVKLKSGPSPFAVEYELAKARGERPGIGFTWLPSTFKPVDAACLSYSVYLGEDFEFGKGGRLPGLYGVAKEKDQGDAAAPEFSTRYTWRADGSGDFYTHLSTWTTGRSMGNDRHGFKFPKGQWVKLDQEVVLNTPGQKDGLLRIWVDGELKFQKTNVLFREEQGPTSEARIAGVLSEVTILSDKSTDKPTAKHKLWLSPYELRWR